MLILIGPRPAARAASMPLQHVGDRKVDVVHAPEHRVVQPVQAHRHALQPGVLAAPCALRASSEPLVVSVRSSGAPSDGAQRGQLLDQDLDVLAQQRLAAGEADLAHAVRDELPRHAGDFLEA